MIIEPVNDVECLSQLTTIARELAPTTLVRTVAQRLGSRRAVVEWLQSLPQTDDRGDELVRFIACDVPQRVRLLPDDPNCVERALGALMLLETIDPRTTRALATVDRPLRHTGLVERERRRWRAVDLFPRRNAGTRNVNWGKLGGDTLQGIHKYVGKPILKFYLGETGGKFADAIGEQQDKALGRSTKKEEAKKQSAPPRVFVERAGAEREDGERKTKPNQQEEDDGKGETNEAQSGLARRNSDSRNHRRQTEAEADHRDSRGAYDAREDPQRVERWWFLR